MGTPKLNGQVSKKGGSANYIKSMTMKRRSELHHKNSYSSQTGAVRTTEDAINLDMFKKNKIKDYAGKNQVQIVLDKVFPSNEKEEKEMNRMIRQ